MAYVTERSLRRNAIKKHFGSTKKVRAAKKAAREAKEKKEDNYADRKRKSGN